MNSWLRASSSVILFAGLAYKNPVIKCLISDDKCFGNIRCLLISLYLTSNCCVFYTSKGDIPVDNS